MFRWLTYKYSLQTGISDLVQRILKKNMKVHLMHLFTVKCKMECPWGANESVRHKGSHYYCTQDVRRHVNWTLIIMTTIMMMMLTIPQIVWQNNWIIAEPACLWESWDRNLICRQLSVPFLIGKGLGAVYPPNPRKRPWS